jgi:hypothetical protein
MVLETAWSSLYLPPCIEKVPTFYSSRQKMFQCFTAELTDEGKRGEGK